MSKTSVMTLRLAPEVVRGVERLARRFGHKPAQVGARLVEGGLRRRDFPQVELRDTVAGRVACVAGTRFAVYWIAQAMQGSLTAEDFAKEYELPAERVRRALAYAAAFPEEIQADMAHAEANRTWLERHLRSKDHSRFAELLGCGTASARWRDFWRSKYGQAQPSRRRRGRHCATRNRDWGLRHD